MSATLFELAQEQTDMQGGDCVIRNRIILMAQLKQLRKQMPHAIWVECCDCGSKTEVTHTYKCVECATWRCKDCADIHYGTKTCKQVDDRNKALRQEIVDMNCSACAPLQFKLNESIKAEAVLCAALDTLIVHNGDLKSEIIKLETDLLDGREHVDMQKETKCPTP